MNVLLIVIAVLFLAPIRVKYVLTESAVSESNNKYRSSTELDPERCTVVTAYFKIESKHSHDEYNVWMENFRWTMR